MSSRLVSLSPNHSLRKLGSLRTFFSFSFSSPTTTTTATTSPFSFSFSSPTTTTTATTSPYLMYGIAKRGTSLDDINATSCIRYYDPAQEDVVIVGEKSIPMEFRRGYMIGMSHGWGLFMSELDGLHKAVYVSDYWNPISSKSNPRVIPLQKVFRIGSTQVDVVINAAMTCPPDQSIEFAVAVKCLGGQINFSRPGGNHEYSDLVISRVPGGYFDHSRIMYSNKDGKFYVPSFRCNSLCSWDALFEESEMVQKDNHLRISKFGLHEFQLRNVPKLTMSEWEVLGLCSKTFHLVETTCGQRFLIKWYAQNPKPGKAIDFSCGGTKRFMVFKEEEGEEGEMIMSYTEDIGDVCIFLGRNEPFCLKASSFPGLKPNSIYFAGDGFGVYDIANRKPTSFRPKSPSAFSMHPLFPYYWIPPMSL